MKVIQLQLCILIWSQAAETLDLQTDLGQNVTINCDLDDEDVYWILQKQSDSPSVILHSFSNPTFSFHLNETLIKKYSVESKHDLIIYNVSVDELGVYYCMNTKTPPKLSNITTLNIIEETQPNEFNTTECKNNTTEQNWTQWKTFTIISALLNSFMIITVLGLIKVYVVKTGCWKICGNSSRQPYETDLQQTQEQSQDPEQLQYVAVDFSKLRKNIRASEENSSYAALKPPKSKSQQYKQSHLS